jgi:hypothetical protein
VRQTHALRGILCRYGDIEQRHLARRVVDQCGDNLPHQLRVVQCHIAQLPAVENGRGIGDYHASDLATVESRWKSEKNLRFRAVFPYRGRGRKSKDSSITRKWRSTTALAVNPADGVRLNRKSKVCTSLPFSGTGTGVTRVSGNCEKARNS